MKVVDVELTEDTQVFLNLEDGSNIAINLRKNYENQIEMSVYTSNIEGTERLSPVIHMVNSNTLALEVRRKQETDAKK